MHKAFHFGHKAPYVYTEYKLKEKFGWTQAEIDAEPAENIEYYLAIMKLEAEQEHGK